MGDELSLAHDERQHFLRRAALAPLCLCLVAGLHGFRVWTARQTPWKGGGFGMFSTVDSEANRFLRAYLITDAGELPLELPAALDKRAAEQRAAASATGLREIARRVAAQEWRWSDERQSRLAAAVAECRGGAISSAALHLGGPWQPAAELGVGMSHALEPIPRGERSPHAVAFQAVRVECWRVRFAPDRELLQTELLVAATVTRAEARP